jgi:palmitoyl-protein thioesterase
MGYQHESTQTAEEDLEKQQLHADTKPACKAASLSADTSCLQHRCSFDSLLRSCFRIILWTSWLALLTYCLWTTDKGTQSRPGQQLSDDVQLQQLANTRHSSEPQLPIVLWHGMGDSCCASWSIGAVATHLQTVLPGTFVHSINTGQGAAADTWSSYYGNVNTQVEAVCEQLRSLPQLDNGYNAVGFSQGGQFLRAVLQRCQHTGPRMHKLITLGGQHQGIMNVPSCWNPSYNVTPSYTCKVIQRILGLAVSLPWVGQNIVQAQYFKDPYHYDDYLANNYFLADINNERTLKNPKYVGNLLSLDQLVLFRFGNDTTVVPRDSAWFGYWDGSKLLSMEETQLYQEDWIGLRQLHEQNKLELVEAPGQHMHFTLDWFDQNVVQQYLVAKDRRS